MKLKAVADQDWPQTLTDAVETMRPEVMLRVWVPHLKVPLDFGPAEGYIQVNDITRRNGVAPVTYDGMCNAKLTEVSGPNALPSAVNPEFLRRSRRSDGVVPGKDQAVSPEGSTDTTFRRRCS